MIPTYFPMTYLPTPFIRRLAACFDQTAVYQPSVLHVPPSVQAGADEGTLAIRIPVAGEAERLEAVMRGYRRWAETHSGAEKAFLMAGGADVPFYDEFSVNRIRTDLRRTLAGESPDQGPDPTFSARVFLCMAQAFDRQDWEVESDLTSFESMEKELMQHLRGGEADADTLGLARSSTRLPRDPGARMAGDRLRAWARLVLSDTEPPSVWVTGSPAVVDEMRDRFPEMTEAGRIESIPVPSREGAKPLEDHKSIREYLASLISTSENPDPPPTSKAPAKNEKVSLAVYRAEISPRWMLSRLVQPDAVVIEPASAAKAVLIGLIEMA